MPDRISPSRRQKGAATTTPDAGHPFTPDEGAPWFHDKAEEFAGDGRFDRASHKLDQAKAAAGRADATARDELVGLVESLRPHVEGDGA
ncbi:hypothetical protein [Georgenia thermotolerans]|uniref:Uncharacterized protein n=1 Tax=Georgenia thermotolerans TaxID=527326 RepID=A0A7J5UJ63_9MICO|nr:hypothetical protein [Georgenia thermotolerans]KAE8762435.1 hypothetical protein GB883_19390 [Georgenia thermotolerans]